MIPKYLSGERYDLEHEYTSEGAMICNPRFGIVISDWDSRCQDRITMGLDFRITEQGKTDVDLEPGMYSIHSPLYGTDWRDENAFEDRFSCMCGFLQGRRYMDRETVCPKCKRKVTFVDTNLATTGWFILDRNEIIHPAIYRKLAWFVSDQHLYQMLKFVPEQDRAKYMDEKSSPFYGIGMIEFEERYDEILDYYLKKTRKEDGYNFLKICQNETFVHSLPCYSSTLRKWMVNNGDVRYSDEDKIFKKLFSDHMLLNDDFEWKRRIDVRKKRIASGRTKGNVDYLRKENILHRIQGYVNDLYKLSFDTISKKEGTINEQILGGRLTESKFSCPL